MTDIARTLNAWIGTQERRRRTRGRIRRALALRRRPRRAYGPLWYEFLIWAARNANKG